MRTILANISSGFFARSFLRTDSKKIIEAANDLRLVLLAPKEKLDYYKKEFPSPNIIFDELPDAQRAFGESFFKFIDNSILHTKTVTYLHKTELYRTGSSASIILRLPRYILRRILWIKGYFAFTRKFFRWLYYLIPSNIFGEIFDKYKPDLVYCPSMVYDDQLILREAKKRGIKTAGMVLSWDNLYSKTFLRVHPDKLLAHTSKIKEQAIFCGNYPEDKIVVTGVPQYDRYFQKKGIIPREEFIKSLGGDPNKKLVLYAFSGKAGLNIEFDIVDILAKAIKEKELRENVQVLVRPYPKFDFGEDRLKKFREKYGFLAASSMAHIGGGPEAWEFDENALSLLTNSLAHADLIITMYSTFFIEGAIFDKPLVGVVFDGYQKLNYWNSAKRFFEWDHLKDIGQLNGIWMVKSKDEFVKAINGYLINSKYLEEGRRAIVRQQCEFVDGESGARVAKELLRLL